MASPNRITPNRLTVLVDEGEQIDGRYEYKTPERMKSGTLSSAMLRTPYSGSVAGSTTKRTPSLSRQQNQWTKDEEPQSLPSQGSVGKRNISHSLLLNGSSSGKSRGSANGGMPGGWAVSSKMGLRKTAMLGLLVLTLLLGGVTFWSSAHSVDEWMSSYKNNDEDSGKGSRQEMYDSSFRKNDYEEMMASLPLGNWNGKRECISTKEYAPDNAAAEKLPELIEIHAWASKKPVEGNSISLVTHLSANRVPDLEDQCLSWPDKIVAAIYVPMTTNTSGGLPLLPGYSSTTLDDMIRGIGSFHRYMETTAACSLDLIFLGQFIKRTDVPGAYPVNALRNKALSLVKTELSIHTNADIVLNPYLEGVQKKGYKNEQTYKKLLVDSRKKTAFLLPILEIQNSGQDLKIMRNIARSHALAGKRSTRDFIEKKMLGVYVSPEDIEKEGIFSVDLLKWAKTGHDVHALVQQGSPPVSSTSEPCVLVATELIPWFDERFVDNGHGASVWMRFLEKKKFKFRVHASGFGVHLAHERIEPKSRYLIRRKEFRMEVMTFMNSTLSENIAKGKYKPMIRECGTFKSQKSLEEDATIIE